jgi:hypothetical protein
MISAAASLLQSLRRIHHSGGDGGVVCEGRGDSEAVDLVRGSVWSLSFVEPHTRNRAKKPDEVPASRRDIPPGAFAVPYDTARRRRGPMVAG